MKKDFYPLYYKVEESIREKIESGEWKPGSCIKSENELMKLFNVSRTTVIKALNNLVIDGMLYRVQGKGTYVSSNKIEQNLSHLYSFAKDIKAMGLIPSTKVIKIEIVEPPKNLESFFNLNSGDCLIKLARLRLANEVPIVFETSYLPTKLFPNFLNQDHENIPLYDLIRDRYKVKIARAKEYFEAVLADERASKYLNIDVGYPLLLFDRKTYGEENVPVESCRGVIRADKYRYSIELKKL